MTKYNVGLLGCGDICDIYFQNRLSSEILKMAACASLHEEKAHRKAQDNIPKGLIGEPTAAAAFVVSPGYEWHHPNPEFFISSEADHCLI